MKSFILALLFVAVLCKKGILIPEPQKLTEEEAKCLVTSKIEFVIIRGYMTIGKVDPNLISNLETARKAGIKDLGVYASLHLQDETEPQIKALGAALKGQKIDIVWINIDIPGWREFVDFNTQTLEEIIAAIKKLGYKVGIMGSKEAWERAFRTYKHKGDLPLLYESLDGKADFKNFKPFGGWTKPDVKHYKSGEPLCKFKAEMLFKN